MVELGEQISLLSEALYCFHVPSNAWFQDFDCHIAVDCGLEAFVYQGVYGLGYFCDQLVLPNSFSN
jgi:hypothetical protein